MGRLIYYNAEVEAARRSFFEKILQAAPPVGLLKFDCGVVAVAASDAQFRKIRSVHDRFLFVAAGEHQAINDVFTTLVSQGIVVEQALSKRELSLSYFLDHPGSVVEQNARIFQSVDTRPRMATFALYSLADAPPCGAVIDPTGARSEVEKFCTIGLSDELVAEKEQMENFCLLPDMPELDAIAALKDVIRSKFKESFERFEIGILRVIDDDVIFEHRREENR